MKHLVWYLTLLLVLLGLPGCSSLFDKRTHPRLNVPTEHYAAIKPKVKPKLASIHQLTKVIAVAINSQTGKKFLVQSDVSAEDASIKAMRLCQQSTEKINACALIFEKGKKNA